MDGNGRLARSLHPDRSSKNDFAAYARVTNAQLIARGLEREKSRRIFRTCGACSPLQGACGSFHDYFRGRVKRIEADTDVLGVRLNSRQNNQQKKLHARASHGVSLSFAKALKTG